MPHHSTRYHALFAAALLALPASLCAQSPRMVLIEEATNASCGPCAEQNPFFENYLSMPHNEEYIIPITFHSRFPGADVMNAANATMHNGRVGFYGISGVPSALVNGRTAPPSGLSYAGAPSDTIAMSRVAAPLRGTISPITIRFGETRNGSAASGTVMISSTEALAGKKLFTVVVERHHHYDQAGTNGEREFYYIARAMLPSEGTDLTLAAGETKELPFSYTISPDWNADDLYLVAFVQDPTTREVMQAATNQGKLDIHSEARTSQVQTATDGVAWSAQLETNNPGNYTVQITSKLPAGWTSQVKVNGAEAVNGGMVTIAGDAANGMDVVITPSTATPGKGWVTVTMLGDLGTSATRTFRAYSSGLQALVLPRDEGNATITAYYDQGMAKTGYAYAVVDQGDEELFDLKEHVVVYEVGKWALQKDEQTKLASLFDRGGRVFMVGAEIAFGLADSRNNDPLTPRNAEFLRSRLHASYIADSTGPFTVYGATNDPIGNALTFSIANGVQNQDTPDRIAPLDGAQPAFYYGSDETRVAGIRYADAKNRLVYLAFGLEGVGDVKNRGEVLKRGIAWLLGSETTSGVEAPASAAGALLGAVGPNPTSGMIAVPFSLDRTTHCSIELYNLRGEMVGAVADESFEAGPHTARFDCSTLPAGVYTVVLRTPERTASRMVTVVR